jgi:type II secretion system protein H
VAPAKSSGFTLIELMVVVILIGILTAMIIPEMRGSFGDALLRSSGRELVNVFSLAYSRAVSQNQVHLVRLDQKTGRFSVERQVHGQGKQPEFAPLKDVSGSSGRLDERIRAEVHKQEAGVAEGVETQAGAVPPEESVGQNLQDAVTFYPDGTAEAAEVLLRDGAGFGLRLRVDPITARVEILKLDPE